MTDNDTPSREECSFPFIGLLSLCVIGYGLAYFAVQLYYIVI